jgi:DNA polymerase-1
VLLSTVKEYLADYYDSFIRPKLEADDVMGILATNPIIITGDKVIVSSDKDMRTIPAKVYNPNRPELGIQTISVDDADRFHLWQTITGDTTDGYAGAKGVGKDSVYSEDVLAAETLTEAWEVVWDAYSSKGLTEEDAIIQARCARILRHEDYNYKDKEPILWEPPLLYG